MTRGPIIREININSSVFQRHWKRLPPYAKEQGIKAIQALHNSPDQRPDRLHLHKLNLYKKSIWTLHLTGDDRYKASFEIHEGIAVFRACGLHDDIDENP